VSDDRSPGAPFAPEPLPHPYFRAPVRPGHGRILPAELSALLHGDSPPVLLDVRPADQRAIARLPGDRWIPFDELAERAGEIPRSRIVVYCHHGGAAQRAAELLRRAGRQEVAVLEGGIDEYARAVDPTLPRYRDPPGGSWVLQQFPNHATGCLAYLLRDRDGDEAIVIDPGQNVEPYLEAVKRQGLRLRAVVETHTHADHLSGHAELHRRTSAPIWLGRRSPAQYAHRPLEDGDGIPLGRSELLVWETPGHTRDHLSLRLDGAVFTGDTLLPGSCGRTDLGDGDPDRLWESLTSKILTLPDETEVFSAHYGPLHGLPPPERYSSTIGFERRTNEALLQPDRPAFLAYMTDGWPSPPPEFDAIVRANLSP
jgi:glyoxylase-like metal-dependent hydrolase (beta-lactamase superfamily II)/rhodanese-related sulfurtransferase